MEYEAKHFEYVGRLYDLALNPEGWRLAIDEYCSFVNAGGGSLHVMDSVNDVATTVHNGGVLTREMMQEYNELYAEMDAEALGGLFKNPTTEFLHDFELLGITDIARIEAHPPIRWINDRAGLFWRAASRLNVTGAWLDVMAVQFPRDHGPMTPEEKEFSYTFLPHFAKVVELGRTFRILESRFNAVLDALDRLNIGVLITSVRGQVVVNNLEAARIVELRDGLDFGQGRILTASENDVRLNLSNAISETTATAKDEGGKSEVLLSVPRKSGKDPFLLAVSPLRDDQSNIDRHFRGALVFVIDPENRQTISTDGLEVLFGLTAAESDVLRKLLDGHSTLEISDIRNSSPETVRKQLKSVMGKTNTHRQSDLVRLAVSVNIPIDEAD